MMAAIVLAVAFGLAMLAAPTLAGAYAEHSMPPKKQMDAGVMPADVECNEGMSLMIRNSGQAICVTSITAEMLEARMIATLVAVMSDPVDEMSDAVDDDVSDFISAPEDEMDAMQSVVFTDAELAWMEANSEVKVAIDPNWFPIEYRDESDNIGGISGEYIALFEDFTELKFVHVPVDTWEDALAAARNGDVDILPAASKTENRTAYLGFTTPHTILTADIIIHDETAEPVETIDPKVLANMTVATTEDYAIEDWLDENRRDIKYKSYKTPQDAMKALGNDDIDVYLDNWLVTDHIAKTNKIEGIQKAGTMGDLYQLAVAYNKDKPELGSILQKVLDTVSERDKLQIIANAVG